MIKISNLNKSFNSKQGSVVALKNINLNVNKGKIFGIIGQSGAGKSTLIRCMNLLERPDNGEVLIKNIDLCKSSAAELRNIRRKIGMIFQHFNLLSLKTVYNNIALPLELTALDKKSIDKKVKELLELTGLSDKANVYPHQLSGGQKQRVAIARALVNAPEVLLCDEATSALDPHTTESILELLRTINKEMGITIVLITHQIEVLKQICDEVAVLANGEIIEQNSLLEFFTKPQTDTAKAIVQKHLNRELPESYMRHIAAEAFEDSIPVVRITFRGERAEKPFISHIVESYQVKANIIQANLETIGREGFGFMMIELDGKTENRQRAIDYLIQSGLDITVLGHVKRHH